MKKPFRLRRLFVLSKPLHAFYLSIYKLNSKPFLNNYWVIKEGTMGQLNYKLAISLFCLGLLAGCSDNKFDRIRFNDLEAEFVNKHFGAAPAVTSSDTQGEFTQELYFLCRTKIKSSEARYFVLKSTLVDRTNKSIIDSLIELQDLKAKKNLTVAQQNLIARTEQLLLDTFKGIEVHFEITKIGAKTDSSWVYSPESGPLT